MSVYSACQDQSQAPEPLPMGGPVFWLIVELKRRRERARSALSTRR